jgi:hypothetical protein
LAGPNPPSCSEPIDESKHRQTDPKRRRHQELAAPPPTTDEVRPARCVACGCASRPVGAGVALHGHGGRDRWVLGVVALGERPVDVVVRARRYACQRCGAVLLVVPRELGPARRYALVAIALAIAGVAMGEPATKLRARLAPGATFETGWASLGRWLRAVAAGKLLRWIRGVSELAGRALAERVSAVLAEASGRDVRSAPFEARVVAGVMSSSES